MIYILPTKRGLGVELWGTHEDLSNLHAVISKFWSDEKYLNHPGYENRDKLISGFSYEIRKGFEGSRLKRKTGHFSYENSEYFGCQLSWIHFLFSLSALRYNMRLSEANKFDISIMLQLEFWLAKAMRSYDEIGANELGAFIDGGLYEGNKYLYQFMRSINVDYFLLGGGKKAFRKLPELLTRGVLLSEEYKLYTEFLGEESKRLGCEISDMEIDDDYINSEKIKW